MTEKPRETQAESHVVELKEKVNNSSLMKHPESALQRRRSPQENDPRERRAVRGDPRGGTEETSGLVGLD